MPNNNNNKKHYKWTLDWENGIKEKIGKEVEIAKLFKKGDQKPDGTTVTKDEGETIKVKVNEVEELFKEIKAHKELAKQKLEALHDKTGQGDELTQIYREYDYLERLLYSGDDGVSAGATNSWKTEKTADIDRYQNFFGTSSGTKYRTAGWKKLQADYYKKQFAKLDGTVDQDYTNLYEFSTRTKKDFNSTANWKLTEQETIKLITRTIAELKKFKKVDWDAFASDTTECALPSTPTVKDRSNSKWNTAVPYTRADLTTWMDSVRSIALVDNELKDESGNGTGKYANDKRLEYSFAQDYTDHDTTTASGGRLTPTQLHHFFNLIEVLGRNYYNWNDKSQFKTALTNAGIAETTTLIVLPAETEPVAESKLKEWGITGYQVDPTTKKTNYYLTNYGTKISDYNATPFKKSEFSWDSKQELKLEGGIDGWIKLVDHLAITNVGNLWLNERKLMSSLVADPISQLFQDIRTTDFYGRFGTAPNLYTLNKFPEQYALAEKRFYYLKARKKQLLNNPGKDQAEIDKLDQEYNEAKTELQSKETQLEAKITEQINWYRGKLKEEFKIDATTYQGFAKTATADNRIEFADVHKLQCWIKTIRYLENGSEEEASSVANENTAWTDLESLSQKVSGNSSGTDEEKKIHHAYTFSVSGGENIQEKIKWTEEHMVNKPWQVFSWQDLIDGFEAIDKIIKLPKHWNKYKEEVKKYMSNPDETEKLPDWQNKLKTLDPLITDTVFTEEKMKDFQKHDGFKKVDGILGLLQKVMDKEGDGDTATYKVKKAFVADYLTKEEAEVNDLGKMFTKFDAEKIIKLISLFDYEKNADADKKKKIRRVYSWDRAKKVADKYVEDNGDYPESKISDEDKELTGDFTKFLYQVATGEKSLSMSKPTEQQENPNNTPTEEKGTLAWLNNHYWWPVWVPLLVVGGGIAVFWKQISDWWNGPVEETELPEETNADDD